MAETIHYDCLIVGGGPAGLTAATYLARFRRNVVLVDAGESRAALSRRPATIRVSLTAFPGLTC